MRFYIAPGNAENPAFTPRATLGIPDGKGTIDIEPTGDWTASYRCLIDRVYLYDEEETFICHIPLNTEDFICTGDTMQLTGLYLEIA